MSPLNRILNASSGKFVRGNHWLRIHGAASTGKKAKRSLHRQERHETRQILRKALED